ncbi:MAG: MBL fold metallo-hydrolase [Promethearchaeota archaeon]
MKKKSNMATRTKLHGDVLEWQWKSNHWAATIPKWSSSFLLDGLLIDTGAPAGSEQIYQWASQLPENDRISQVYLTHFHEDHAGGALILQERMNLPILCSSSTQKQLESIKPYRWYRQVYWGKKLSPPLQPQLISDKISSESGKFNFNLISCPGHAPDLTALLESEHQLLFVGDAIMKRYEMLFGGGCKDIQENIKEIYLSQKRLYELTEGMNDLQIFVAHAKVYPRSFLKEKIDEIEKLHLDAHHFKEQLEDQGVIKTEDVVKKIVNLLWKKGENRFAKFMSKGELSHANLVKSLLEWDLD